MAGRPNCDYDYNDRSWGGMMAAEIPSGTPVVVGSLQATWLNPDAQGESMTVTSTVTYDAPGSLGQYRWQYHVTNNNVGIDAGKGAGVYNFSAPVSDQTYVTSVELSNPWASGFTTGYGVPGQLLSWVHSGETDPDTLLPGESADFAFITNPKPVAKLTGESLGVGAAYAAIGLMLAPGLPPKADIDIGGTYTDMATSMPVAFDETTEDTIGGLVVKQFDANDAPRKSVIINKLVDANNQPVIGGKVRLTIEGGKVSVWTAATGGVGVPSGRVYDNANLPVTLYVQGNTESGAMRDVKLKAKPVGAVGIDDTVAFTVLWVNVSVKVAGKVDPLNSARPNYLPLPSNGGDNLGIQQFAAPPGIVKWGVGIEAKGEVMPENFSYPGVQPTLRRDVEAEIYFNGASAKSVPFSDNLTPADTAEPEYRDDTPPLIFDLDAPGPGGPAAVQGTTVHFRANFRSFAVADGVRASERVDYYVRVGIYQSAAGNPKASAWGLIPANAAGAFAGDNKAAVREHTPLSLNLQ